MGIQSNGDRASNIIVVTCLTYTLLLCLFVIAGKSQPNASTYPMYNESIRNRRGAKRCVVKNKISLEELKKLAWSSRRRPFFRMLRWSPGLTGGPGLRGGPGLSGRPGLRGEPGLSGRPGHLPFKSPITADFKFSKVGCMRYDRECPCKNRIWNSAWGHPFPDAPSDPHGLLKRSIPWMLWITTDVPPITCSGVLISYKFALTSARCVRYRKYVKVHFGVYDRFNDTNVISFTIHPDQFILNPLYPDMILPAYWADTALIHLGYALQELKLTFDPFVSPACLSRDVPKTGWICNGAGWSVKTPSRGVKKKPTLRWTKFIIQGTEHDGIKAVTAARDKETYGSCYDDFGSPLMCEDKGVTRVYGVLSHGFQCGHHNRPAYYVMIGSHYKWMTDTMKNIVNKDPERYLNASSITFKKYDVDLPSTLASSYVDETPPS